MKHYSVRKHHYCYATYLISTYSCCYFIYLIKGDIEEEWSNDIVWYSFAFLISPFPLVMNQSLRRVSREREGEDFLWFGLSGVGP